MRTPFEIKEERGKIAVMAILLAVACLITYYFHSALEMGAVFTHFFYIPIIIASLWWKRKGIGVALFLSAWLFFSHVFVSEHIGGIHDLIRMLMFIIISFVVALLSERIEKTKRALWESEESQKAIFETAQDAIFIKDRALKYTRVNPAMARLFDVPASKLVGRTDHDLFGKEAGEPIRKVDARVLGGEIIGEEYTEQVKGSPLTFHVIKVPMHDRSGEIIGLCGIARDITERKQMEEQIKRQNEFLNHILESLSHPFCVIDAHDYTIKVANSAARMGDLSEHTTCYALTHKRDRPCGTVEHLCPIEEIKKTKKAITVEHLHYDKEGNVRNVEVHGHPIFDREGNVLQIIEYGFDITERKRADEERRFLSSVVEQASEGMAIADLEGKLLFVNHAWSRMHGYKSMDELIGRHLGIFHSQKQLEKDVTLFNQKVMEKGSHSGEVGHIRKDGTPFSTLMTTTLLKDETGKPIAIAGIARDLSERKLLESRLVQEQKLASIGQLAAGIAHEINTPIQYVGDNTRFFQESFTDLFNVLEKYHRLLETTQTGSVPPELVAEMEKALVEADVAFLSEEIPTAIKQSLEGIDRVTGIVQAMRAFSHPGISEKASMDLNKAIESTITVARNEWKYVAEMEMDFDVDLPLVHCLPGELNQVILNIILNAAHAISDVVGDGSKGMGTITVSTRREDEWVEIRIRDTGTGIPEAVRSKVFDPFFTTKEVGKGTGQGLAIAHNVVVEKHGGTITFETESGKGTTFVIRLPIEDKST